MERQLAKLGSKAQSYDQAGFSYGAISSADISAALIFAKLTPIETALIIVKHQNLIPETAKPGDMREKYNESVIYLRACVRTSAAPMVREGGHIESLVDLLMGDIIRTPRCLRCKGNKYVVIDNLKVVCDACKGTGLRKTSAVKIGQACNVPERSARRNLQDPYFKIVQEYRYHELNAQEALKPIIFG